MAVKYTREDLIFFSDDVRLENAVGKQVYFGDVPLVIIDDANEDSDAGILESIDETNPEPFKINGQNWACLILKKEPKKKYVPFDLSDEKVRDSLRGKWVTDGEGYETMITAIFRDMVADEMVANGRTAERLLKEYTFLDGSPCGVEVEE